jgi:hypothetical protein
MEPPESGRSGQGRSIVSAGGAENPTATAYDYEGAIKVSTTMRMWRASSLIGPES